MQLRSYVPRLIAGIALGSALLVPTVASADTDNGGLVVIGNPRTTSYYDATGTYAGSSRTTQDITLLGDGLTAIGNPTTTQYYDANGNYAGSSRSRQDLTVLGD